MLHILFDLDNTLALPHLDPAEAPASAPEHHTLPPEHACHPVPPLCIMARLMDADTHATASFTTNLPERFRQPAEAWIRKNCRVADPLLLMRPEGSTQPETTIKSEHLSILRRAHRSPAIVIDDRPSAVRMWRSNDIVCLNPGHWTLRPNSPRGRLILTVGPPASGKRKLLADTDYLRSVLHATADAVISPALIRTQLHCPPQQLTQPEARRQAVNNRSAESRVFAIARSLCAERVRHGLPAILQATSLRPSQRIAFRRAMPPDTPVTYLLIDRPLQEKLREHRNNANPPFPVAHIRHHHETFQQHFLNALPGDGLPTDIILGPHLPRELLEIHHRAAATGVLTRLRNQEGIPAGPAAA